ncbi:MAG: SCO family protein [Myxococcaceae bacterium]|nr:SCO family protein [Myxococcaceae bacterium]MCI0672855.1 SCO family protein [Myxococcaceae bacterium]
MRVLPLTLVLALGVSSAAGAAPQRRRGHAQLERVTAPKLPDEQLVDQDGMPVRLASELMKDRVVAVNFVFSTCSTICSPMSAVFGKLRSELGDAVGRDVHLVSITLDPANDTPEKLKKFSSMFKRGDGWTFVTGEPQRVTRALKALGGWVPNKEAHTPVTLVGNTTTGKWVRVFGMPTTKRLKEALAEVGLTESEQRQPLKPQEAP